MNKTIKYVVYTLSIMATILISIGLYLSLRDLMDGEDMYNMADDSSYYYHFGCYYYRSHLPPYYLKSSILIYHILV